MYSSKQGKLKYDDYTQVLTLEIGSCYVHCVKSKHSCLIFLFFFFCCIKAVIRGLHLRADFLINLISLFKYNSFMDTRWETVMWWQICHVFCSGMFLSVKALKGSPSLSNSCQKSFLTSWRNSPVIPRLVQVKNGSSKGMKKTIPNLSEDKNEILTNIDITQYRIGVNISTSKESNPDGEGAIPHMMW